MAAEVSVLECVSLPLWHPATVHVATIEMSQMGEFPEAVVTACCSFWYAPAADAFDLGKYLEKNS